MKVDITRRYVKGEYDYYELTIPTRSASGGGALRIPRSTFVANFPFVLDPDESTKLNLNLQD